MHMPIRVALADDHVLVRQGLKSLLEREEFRVVAEAADGQEAVTQAVSLNPDIAIMDISMPMLNGIDAARELGRACPKTKVILLTQHEEDQYILEALEAGVKGYVLKSQVASDLVHAIQQVSRGMFYLSPGVSRTVIEAYRTPSAATDCGGEVDEGRGFSAGHQRENGGITSIKTHAETGYP